jgi:hypothetical protein
MTSAVTQTKPASTAAAVATAAKVRWSAAARAAPSRHVATGDAAKTVRSARQRHRERRVSQQTVAVAATGSAFRGKCATVVSAARAAGSAPTARGAKSAAASERAVNCRTTPAARSTPPVRPTKRGGFGASQPCGRRSPTLRSCRPP